MKRAIVQFWGEKQGAVLQMVLGAVVIVFIGILIGAYVVAKKANPVFLDEKGKPVNGPSEETVY